MNIQPWYHFITSNCTTITELYENFTAHIDLYSKLVVKTFRYKKHQTDDVKFLKTLHADFIISHEVVILGWDFVNSVISLRPRVFAAVIG